MMPEILERLRDGLIVSCQPVPGGPMDRPETVAAFALAALAGGAVGVRIEGLANVRAVRAVTPAPIIGLIKRDLSGSPVRITPYLEDVDELAAAGADVIAFDSTDRPRPAPREAIVAAIHASGRIAMADCSTSADGHAARALGVRVLGSTLSGYTVGAVPEAPDLDLVADLSRMDAFVIAEGRYHGPDQAAQAIRHGADAVVVGSAITRTEHVTEWFSTAIRAARQDGSRTQPVLSVDLGGSKILAALVRGREVVAEAEVATDRAAGPDAWLQRIAEIARPWAGAYARAGISVTGLVAGGRWRALNPGTLDIPEDFELQARAEALLGVPVALANDAQAAAWGEFAHGAGDGADLVFLTVSTGIGGGVVAGGRLISGRGGLAGSFGQLLPFAEEGASRFEDGASGRWIGAEGARIGLAGADARAVFAAAAHGNAQAEAIIARSAGRIARLCHGIQFMFDPDRIVIGGGVGLAPGYLDRVTRALAHLDPLVRPDLVAARLGRDAGIIGMADLALGKPNNWEKHK
jgi:N-acetylmannosamine-6-phosphate 2-epimerase / N-acetylmannosamine kinase